MRSTFQPLWPSPVDLAFCGLDDTDLCGGRKTSSCADEEMDLCEEQMGPSCDDDEMDLCYVARGSCTDDEMDLCYELGGSCLGDEADLCEGRRLEDITFLATAENLSQLERTLGLSAEVEPEPCESQSPLRLLSSHAEAMQGVNLMGDAILAKAEAAATTMVDETFIIDPEIQGARSNLATRQLMLREKMMKEAVMVSMGAASKETLEATLDDFSASQNILLNGNGGTGKDAIGRTEIDQVRRQMMKVQAAWNAFKPEIMSISDGADVSMLTDLANSSTSLGTEMTAAGALYTTVVATTTKSPIDILFPLPFTGSWDPGNTMRTTALVAQDIINTKQIVLPGHLIQHTFLESKCDADFAMRETLKGFASSDKWVALGGMACYSVCSALAIISASMFIPAVSYGCSGESLSDESIYPDFVRLGTKTTAKIDVVSRLGKLFDWKHIAIVTGNPGLYRAKAETLMDKLKAEGFSTSYESAMDDDWSATQSMMKSLIQSKYRHVFFMGNDHFFRVVLCAAKEVKMTTGMTWISEDIRRRSWWTDDDPAVIAHDATCTGNALSPFLQGAINIAGMGAPLDSEADKPLDCFDGYTSRTFRQAVMDGLANGYTTNNGAGNECSMDESDLCNDGSGGGVKLADTMEERPFDEIIGLVADGTCLIAKAVQRMVDMGYNIETLRSPTSPVYKDMVKVLRAENFTGASGYVTFQGNDKPGYLGIWQVRANESIMVGNVDPNGINFTMSYEDGLRNDTWTAAPADVVAEEFPWVVIPATFIGVWQCGAILLGLWRSTQELKAERAANGGDAATKKAAETAAADAKTKEGAGGEKKEKKKGGWFGDKKKGAAEDAQLLGNPAQA